MTNEMTAEPSHGRLLIEIFDLTKDIDFEVISWIGEETARRCHQDGSGTVEVWLADSDDAGPMGDGRNRVVLLHRPVGEGATIPPAPGVPAWVVRRHTYDATAVSERRADGRPDPRTAAAMRFVAMNCAEGAEDEFHAWY